MICFIVYKLQPIALHLLVKKSLFFLPAEIPEIYLFFLPLGKKNVTACVENSNPN